MYRKIGSEDETQPNLPGEPASSSKAPRKVKMTISARFDESKRKQRALKARLYREKVKAKKLSIKKIGVLKWEKIGGARKVCMRVHQYDMPELQRILLLGTCPTARGAFIPTARIASHMTHLLCSSDFLIESLSIM